MVSIPLIHAYIDLDGQMSYFARVINCQPGSLKRATGLNWLFFRRIGSGRGKTGRDNRTGKSFFRL